MPAITVAATVAKAEAARMAARISLRIWISPPLPGRPWVLNAADSLAADCRVFSINDSDESESSPKPV